MLKHGAGRYGLILKGCAGGENRRIGYIKERNLQTHKITQNITSLKLKIPCYRNYYQQIIIIKKKKNQYHS